MATSDQNSGIEEQPHADDEVLTLTQRWAAERVPGRQMLLLVGAAAVVRPFIMIGKGLYALRWIVLGPVEFVRVIRYLRRSRDE